MGKALEPQSNQRGIETGSPPGPGWPSATPQSNQRGIETWRGLERELAGDLPQSNQRGIETEFDASVRDAGRRGLNRTSVGLKQRRFGLAGVWWMGLNRTSVGLKLGGSGSVALALDKPQSNQRGIETVLG